MGGEGGLPREALTQAIQLEVSADDVGVDAEANLHILFFYCRTLLQQLVSTVNYFPRCGWIDACMNA